ncbi:UDP-glycosyltransferase 88A1-like [Rosa sericea]
MDANQAIVLYPSPPIGHLVSMVELGKLILTHHPSLSIHIILATPPYRADDTAPYIASVSATTSSIIFLRLPTVSLPPSITSGTRNHETLTFEVLRLNNPHVHQALLSISNSFTVQAFIMDFFCGLGLSVATDLNIPGYFYLTSGAGFLASFLYLPTIHKNTDKSLKDLDTLICIPGVPPVHSLDMPKPFLERNDKAYECFLENSTHSTKSAGIIINTFESLEPRTIRALSDGLCLPVDITMPPIYCIGPLIISQRGGGRADVPECLTWLDSQPSGSVVFLCFGSLGLFTKEQLEEIAVGLERSGQRFLWVVRNPPSHNQSVAIAGQVDPDLDYLLPDGFLDRTKDRGLVVKSWAPQVEVLNHDSVGGFVCHCGWNSILEAVCAGVPMLAWPLYAEQRLNRVVLVEEIKIALPVNESKSGFVSANEVENRVRELMDSEEGESIRKKIEALRSEANAALSDGGTSKVALAKLVESWNQGRV